MAWTHSTRRARLPRDWAQRVAHVKARARGLCQATTHTPPCDMVGRECDHIISGDNHALSNLQWLSPPCHAAKTIADNAARRACLKLPAEQHPSGLRRQPR